MLLSWLYEGFVAWSPISTCFVGYGNRLSSALSGQIMKDMVNRESFVPHTKEMTRKSTAGNTRAQETKLHNKHDDTSTQAHHYMPLTYQSTTSPRLILYCISVCNRSIVLIIGIN